jgi:acyl-coenzyme A synthetase/AMP-(fatty) acid ligase
VEVEAVLAEHESVREVAVIGVPDPVRQEIVAAVVSLKPAVRPSDELRQELQAFVRSRLSPYKYPRRIEFVDTLPRDQVGKVQPRALKERFGQQVSP